MTENREWLRKDAALEWELTQIKNSGPNFREQIAAAAGAEEEASNAPLGGGGEMPTGGEAGGGAETPPEFGNMEAGAPPEAGAAEVGNEVIPTEAPGAAATPPAENLPTPG